MKRGWNKQGEASCVALHCMVQVSLLDLIKVRLFKDLWHGWLALGWFGGFDIPCFPRFFLIWGLWGWEGSFSILFCWDWGTG